MESIPFRRSVQMVKRESTSNLVRMYLLFLSVAAGEVYANLSYSIARMQGEVLREGKVLRALGAEAKAMSLELSSDV